MYEETLIRETDNSKVANDKSWHGTIINAPAVGESAFVVVKGIDVDTRRGPAMWQPMLGNNGYYTPGGGEDCLVTFDDQKVPWITMWLPGSNSKLVSQPTNPIVSALPAEPKDGDIIRYQNAEMATEGVVWSFRYRSGSLSTHKWEFIGGGDFGGTKEVEGATTIESATYVASGGPSIVVPLVGDYNVMFGSRIGLAVGNFYGIAAVKFGSETTVDTNSILHYNPSEDGMTTYRQMRKGNLAAGVTLEMQYRVSVAAKKGIFEWRTLTLRPVRVG